MTHLLPLLSALRRAGCDVHLLCLGGGGLAEEAGRRGLPVAVLPMAGARDPRVLRPLRRLLVAGPTGMAGQLWARSPEVATPPTAAPAAGPPAAETPAPRWDVVHSHGMRANLPVRLATRGLRHRPCLFTTVHSDVRLDYESPQLAHLYQVLDRSTLGCVDGMICVSDALRALLVERGYPGSRLTTVRSGLEVDRSGVSGPTASGPASDAVPGPAVTSAEPRRPRVGTVARLAAVKDLDLLVEVAALLRRTHPEVEVLIVGDGPDRPRLEARAIGAGLADTVRFTGRLADVTAVLDEVDVYLITSVFEGGVSMSVLEAMAAGIPVVTTAAGGVAEAVVEGKTGYVVSRNQDRGALAAELAQRVAGLLDDPALRARLGAAGAERVRALFTVEQTAARTLRAYERCLAARETHF